jgi:hypothetical protein
MFSLFSIFLIRKNSDGAETERGRFSMELTCDGMEVFSSGGIEGAFISSMACWVIAWGGKL